MRSTMASFGIGRGSPAGARASGRHASDQAVVLERMAGEIGELFRDLRRVLKLSLPDLARRLDTRIEVISALEKGDVSRLPPWPETVRVVSAFTAMGRIDPVPVLSIIRKQMDRGAIVVGASDATAARVNSTGHMSARRSVAEGSRAALGRFWARAVRAAGSAGMRRHMRQVDRKHVIVFGTLCLLLAGYLVRDAEWVSSFAALSPSLERLVRGAQDYVLVQTAPSHDGLKWIDVDDPRSRRGDLMRVDQP